MDPFGAALDRAGVVDLALLADDAARSARRHDLVVVQRGAALARTQPAGPIQHMHAAALSARKPYALLSASALWAHGVGPLPDVVEVGVDDRRGLTLRPPVVVRRVATATLAQAVVRRGLYVVRLETAVVQRAADLSDARVVAALEQLLRSRATTPQRMRDACRRGFAGSRKVRMALLTLSGGDLELQKRRLRRALEAGGVTGLRSEVRLVSANGASCYLDLLHEPTRKALEVDGGYHALASQRSVDRRRDRWIQREHGITVVRVADEELRRDLVAVVEELIPELRAA